MKKKLVSLVLALLLCLSCALPASAAGGSRFTDVPDNAWYAEAVNALADGGILAGRGNGIFDPNAKVTLAELSVVLMRLRGMGDQIADDIHWAGNAMYSMFGLGCEWSDAENAFMRKYTYASDPAYRGDAVAALGSWARLEWWNKYFDAHHYDYSDPLEIFRAADAATNEYAARYDLSGIADRDAYYSIASSMWYEGEEYIANYYGENGHFFVPDHIDQAYQFGVISGIDKNHTCNATGTLTRAELAQMCYNMGWTTAGCVSDVIS